MPHQVAIKARIFLQSANFLVESAPLFQPPHLSVLVVLVHYTSVFNHITLKPYMPHQHIVKAMMCPGSKDYILNPENHHLYFHKIEKHSQEIDSILHRKN